MINHPKSQRDLDLLKYIPIYMRDEQIVELFKIFESAMNNMYDAASDHGKSYDISTVNQNIVEQYISDDTSPILFKYPLNPVDPENLASVKSYPEWPYNENLPSESQLNPIPNSTDITPIEYPNDIPNADYFNTAPPQTRDVEIPWPGPESGPYKIHQGFDYRAPIDVQARGANEYPGDSVPPYNKMGLYNTSDLYTGVPRPIPGHTKYNRKKQVNISQEDHLSILEKIYRLIDLKDPAMMDIKYIQYFADYMGYDLDFNLDDFGNNLVNKRYGQYYTEKEKQENIEKQVRAMVESLPHWYKIKTTENALKIILYSFGLVADILTYYTKDYSHNRQDWETADKKNIIKRYKSWSDDRYITIEDFYGSVKEGRPEIPDEWYPTPHFEVRYSINNSFDYETGSLFNDETKFAMLSKAIDAAKPINTVFEGLAALFQTRDRRMITAYSIVNTVVYHDAIATDDDGILPIATA